jgi:N-acetylmuramoyl-L-alanine amidase
MNKVIKSAIIPVCLLLIAAAVLSKAKVRPVITNHYSQTINHYVIDPGHGGTDGGATVGDVVESKINLDIALKLDALMGLLGAPAVLTRDSETLDYPANATTLRKKKNADMKARVELANYVEHSTGSAVFVSIHQNKFSSASVHGAQVFYSDDERSGLLAKRLQTSLRRVLDPDNDKISKQISDSVFIMREVKCPAVLIECGFISNARECALLIDDAYQTKLAAAIAAGLLEQ